MTSRNDVIPPLAERAATSNVKPVNWIRMCTDHTRENPRKGEKNHSSSRIHELATPKFPSSPHTHNIIKRNPQPHHERINSPATANWKEKHGFIDVPANIKNPYIVIQQGASKGWIEIDELKVKIDSSGK